MVYWYTFCGVLLIKISNDRHLVTTLKRIWITIVWSIPLSAGEVFHPPSLSSKVTLQQAREECKKHDSVLASPGHLYAAWRAGLDRCDYSWMSDGSARYPVTIPRPQCGGGLLGVRTLYKYENQTGYPDPTERFGVFCFKGETETYTDAMPSVPNISGVYANSVFINLCPQIKTYVK